MKDFFEIQDLEVRYGEIPVLRGISMSAAPGEILGVVGESGSGKSTAIYASLGILERGGKVTGGSIRYCGEELLGMPLKKLRSLRGREISFIAQNPIESFHPAKKLKSQLRELIHSHRQISCREAEEQMRSLLERMQIKETERVLDSYAFELSGGMCQRVSIAMAMLLKPKLLLADEPTSALDVTVQKQVAEELLKVREQFGTAVFLVSHNMGVVSYMADSIAVMYAGLVLEYGRTEQIVRNPCHPYTNNLMQAIPSIHGSIPVGVVALKSDKSAPGCPYYEGCSRRSQTCKERIPEFSEVESGHYARCIHI